MINPNAQPKIINPNNQKGEIYFGVGARENSTTESKYLNKCLNQSLNKVALSRILST